MKFEWENLDDKTMRAKVYGGWIVNSYNVYNKYSDTCAVSEALCFIPDPNHEWEITNE